VSLNAASLQISNSLKAARVVWEDTRERWDDVVAIDFQKNYWEPLKVQVDALLVAMDRLSPVLDRAVRECS
jgi:hypothetical protein